MGENKMKYRDILGLSKKESTKKNVKRQQKTSLSDLLKEQFGDRINEGPSYEYAKVLKDMEKTENLQAKAVNKFVKILEKKGFPKEARNVSYEYMNNMRKFNAYIKELVGKLL